MEKRKSEIIYPSESMAGSDIKPIFIVLVDISGYTRFIRFHRVSLLHAEKIIGELMESILKEVQMPVMTHEILGDAISMYAIDEGSPHQANSIYGQLHKYFRAFREREAMLISACNLCRCDACRQVGQLKLKAILHFGHAAFTRVQNIQKISGEAVILSHRLLKNSLASKEYILMTDDYVAKTNKLDRSQLGKHKEYDRDLGAINLWVKDLETAVQAAKLQLWPRLKEFLKIEGYMISRFFKKATQEYRNIPSKL